HRRGRLLALSRPRHRQPLPCASRSLHGETEMTRAWLAAILLTATAAPAGAEDPRLVERLYDPDEVVVIEGRTNVQATIRFGEDEFIENVAIGDSTKWQVTPNRR